MTVKLRPYQADLDRDTREAWAAGAVDVMAVSATGSGKTVFFSHMMQEHNGGSIAVAHRQELTSQISTALARNRVRHRIIGQPALIKNINALHIADLGRSYYDANARHAAAGVDTLIRLKPHERGFCAQTTLFVQDEAHHSLRGNKWGAAREMFPNAKGLHVTATPVRADGKGLGRHADGYIDTMVMAPTMRDLINMGYLTDYRVICAESHLALSESDISDATGDFNQSKVRKAVHEAKITGDVVREYLRWAKGKLGVTFAVDVEHATEIAVAFREAGVPAEVVSAKTPDALRMEILRRFRRREVMQLVNVDLFGEGFDLPAIEVVSFARPTASWSLYCQQFGRALRLMLDPSYLANWDSYDDATRRYFISISSKPAALIIDHVGNIVRHMGPPDKRIEFSLDRRERRGGSGPSDAIPYRVCTNKDANKTGLPCARPYERVFAACPYCGHHPEPAARSAPEFVDGDLIELDAETLARMRGEIERVNNNWVPIPAGANPIIAQGIRNRHYERQQAQAALRGAMSWWAGLQDALGRPNLEEQYRRFYLNFGIDTATAQSLPAADAEKLRAKICEQLLRYGIDATVNPALP